MRTTWKALIGGVAGSYVTLLGLMLSRRPVLLTLTEPGELVVLPSCSLEQRLRLRPQFEQAFGVAVERLARLREAERLAAGADEEGAAGFLLQPRDGHAHGGPRPGEAGCPAPHPSPPRPPRQTPPVL